MKLRSRIVRESFFSSEQVLACSPLARLLFIGLWCLADREGRLEDRPRQIKNLIFPEDKVDIGERLTELVKARLIARYEAEEQAFIWIPKFLDNQNVNSHEKPSILPVPDASIQKHMQASASICDPASRVGKGNGEDRGNGRGEGEDPKWAAEDLWLQNFLEHEQTAFNGVHLPTLLDNDWWNAVADATNGIDQPFLSAEFAKMRAWMIEKPNRVPTPNGTKKFVRGWLERAADRARSKSHG